MKYSQKDVDELAMVLAKHSGIGLGMSIAEFDGFCTGLIVCPEMISPSEWLPCVWGGREISEFDDMDAFQADMDCIMGHYNRVAKILTPPCHTLETIYETDPNSDEILWEPWVDGFNQALELRPDAWDVIAASGNKELLSDLALLIMLQAFCLGELELSDDEIEDLDNEAPDMIPNIILNLNDWVKSQEYHGFPFALSAPANLSTKPILGKKASRNEPCPCGSGKKYKKCCGNN